jgi:FtsZ-interacting cell division protein ZipA
MRVSALQLGLIVAGILLVAGVIVYNAWQERRIRRRITSAFRKPDDSVLLPVTSQRVEPTMRSTQRGVDDGDAERSGGDSTDTDDDVTDIAPAAGLAKMADDDSTWSPPIEIVPHPPLEDDVHGSPAVTSYATAPPDASGPQPDRDIECMVILQPAKPLGAGALAAGLHARMGKRLRWFGRAAPGSSWVMLHSATPGEFVELTACLLLADRNGAASHAQLDTFVRVMSELAPMLPAALSVPDVAAETDRAEALDRLCADVDVQIGLTILKQEPANIPGTRLRGVAEAAGFRLASGGRFEWPQEETGAILYTLQNIRNEPFTVDTLRSSATNGVVLVLDVPRVSDPPRAFDQMKLAAKRIAHTLGGDLVDDNRRPLDDEALAAIRQHVQIATDALKACRIDPGSPRAQALFGA